MSVKKCIMSVCSQETNKQKKEGLFGFNPKCDFKTISIRDNIIECQGQQRPLLRNKESFGATIQNNTLTNISDAKQYENAKADRTIGPEAPLKFECGVHGEFTVADWKAAPTKK